MFCFSMRSSAHLIVEMPRSKTIRSDELGGLVVARI